MTFYRGALTALALAAVGCSTVAGAGPEAFDTGPTIENFGPAASVPGAPSLGIDDTFKIAFDVGEAGADGKHNRRFESAARVLNLHALAGAPAGNTRVAIVVHGSAAMDLVTKNKRGEPNPSEALVAALVGAGVRIELCGQTARYRDIGVDDLLPGVTMSQSAITSHALLQQQGYTLNPF